MIQHEAWTRTIRLCKGLSDDRIRKAYTTYFRDSGDRAIKQRRGKSPRQISLFVKTPPHQLKATTLIALFCNNLLLRADTTSKVYAHWPRTDVEYGHRVCRAFETYQILHPAAALNFEWAWNLLRSIVRNDELYLAVCRRCWSQYVQDAYALDRRICPSCSLSGKPH
jgi:hypothetical protein